VNLDKSLVFVIVRCYFLNLFPFNFVFSRGGGARGLLPPLCTPLCNTFSKMVKNATTTFIQSEFKRD